MNDLKFYSINKDYIDYLRKTDTKVPRADYQLSGRHEKLYCGVVLLINNYLYFAPLSHQISNPETSFLIRHKNGNAFASLRLKFMVPVANRQLLTLKNFASETNVQYRGLLSEELTYCRQNSTTLKEHAQRVYHTRIQEKRNFQRFCCDFKALELAADQY